MVISSVLWLPCTSATSARLYKKELKRHAKRTSFPGDVNIGFACHDFSMRGMAGIFVTHMVNRKGIENLAKTFNKVYFTNSYRTWDNLPDNVIQIEII